MKINSKIKFALRNFDGNFHYFVYDNRDNSRMVLKITGKKQLLFWMVKNSKNYLLVTTAHIIEYQEYIIISVTDYE